MLCYFCYVLFDIRRNEDISREDAHYHIHDIHMYLPTKSKICIIYCPLPHQSLENGLGVSLLCTCAAFSPFAKLNRYFLRMTHHSLMYHTQQRGSISITSAMTFQYQILLFPHHITSHHKQPNPSITNDLPYSSTPINDLS
jgi:hypothetical protein